MVKNVTGGNRGKRCARKHMGGGGGGLRKSENCLEVYAVSTRMLGNNMFHCECLDGVFRLCHIRGKFTGRKKRDNMISVGTCVLVGLRDWSNPDEGVSSRGRAPECDILEVYSSVDVERLKDGESVDWSVLLSKDVSRGGGLAGASSMCDEGVVFSSEDDGARRQLEASLSSVDVVELVGCVDVGVDLDDVFDDI